MDTRAVGGPAAGLVDAGLILLFALPHSVLARTSVKTAMNLPAEWERSVYIFQSSALLHIQMIFWQNFEGGAIWDVSANEPLSAAIVAIFFGGFFWLLSSTFALDHFELCGLTQAFGIDFNKVIGLSPASSNVAGLVVRWHYQVVAHPIMMGMMIGCWATPVMSAPRLLLAVMNT
jgi:hypothetical protein